MSEAVKTSRPWLKRSLWLLAGLIILLFVTIAALRIFITTESGASFIESQLSNRNLGPIERVDVSGLSGDPLSYFTIKSVKIYDKDGVWLTADNIAVDWNPWALLRKVVDIQSAASEGVNLMRRPVLNETSSGGDLPTFQLENGSIKAFTLNEVLMGQSAIFTLSGGMSTRKSGEIKALLDAIRTDAAGDKLRLDFTRNTYGEMQGKFDLKGAKGGTLAALLRAPSSTEVIGMGQIGGTRNKGQGDIIINFDGDSKLRVKGNWTPETIDLKGDINTIAWSLFDNIRAGIGDNLEVTASLNRTYSPAAFDIAVISNRLKATASGQLNPEGGLPKTAQISASSDNIGSILPLPDGFALGAGQIKGRVARQPNYSFAGDVKFANIVTPYGQAASINGPVSLSQGSQNYYRFDGELLALDMKTPLDIPIELSSETTLKAKANFNTQTSQINDIIMTLYTGENRLSVTGAANYDAMTFNLTGATELGLAKMGALPAGRLQSEFTVLKSEASLPALTANGALRPHAAISAPFDQLLIGGVNFDVDMSPLAGGLRIKNAAISGQNIKAAMSGRITDQFDVVGEALLSAPFTYAPVALSGETAASFTLTGNKTDPNLRLDTRADTIEVYGYALAKARLRAELSDILNAPKGPLRFTADTPQGGLDFSADFASREKVYVANDIDISWGPLSATGNITKPISGPASGQLSLNLPETGDQYAKANLTLSANGDSQGIKIDAEAKNIAYKDWAFDSLALSTNGNLSSLSGSLEAKGQRELEILERQFNIKTLFNLTRPEPKTFEASLEPDANYGNITLNTAAPINASYDEGAITVNAPLKLAGSPFDIVYARSPSREKLAIKISDLPITIIPMSGNLADTLGRIGADISFSTSDASPSVSGGGVVTIKDWRGFDVAIGEGLSGDLTLDTAASRLNWQLDAQSPGGFRAKSEGVLPVIQTQSLLKLRPNMSAPLSGNLTASGQAASILGLITPSDAKPTGQLDANLKISGTAASPNIEGQASAKALRIEAPDLGTQIRNGRFTASFTNNTLDVRDVSLTDNSKGTITGDGQFKLGEFGRPIGDLKLNANNFSALDRKDYEGTVSGKLGFKSTEKEATLTGDVTLNRAEVKQFVGGNVSVVEIPVEEINKTEMVEPTDVKAPASPINLDVKLRAPRRIFVRSRGLDVELSIDSAIKGTTSAVEIYGDATVLRGSYKIAGKELAFESGGIKFNGDLSEARVSLVAEADTQNLSARIDINGTVANPEVKLSSTPERPQDEILSALLFGRSATELSTIEAAQLAAALAQFSGAGGSFDLMGGLRDALGVGQLSIGVGQDGGAQITGGRYLAKNVYLQVFSGGGKGQTGALIEWEVRKNLALTSKIQADNDQSFSLKWKRDF